VNHSNYLSIIGKLNYVSIGTRLDITYAVNCLARFFSRQSPKHWKALNHLVFYLAGTKDRCLKISPSRTDVRPVECFTNANWGGPNAQSTYRVLICLYGCPIMWVSRRHVTVASSTCQAKYMALGHATRHSLWIRNLLQDVLGVTFTVHVFCNNQSAVKIACKDASNKRTQHVERELYVSNQALHQGKTQLNWIPGKDQLAKVLTKALGKSAHDMAGLAIHGYPG
jgi:hypothetical protein